MLTIDLVWREERASAFALTDSGGTVHVPPLMILWRRRPADHWGPFLVDAKRSGPQLPLSELGRAYLQSLGGKILPLRYCFIVKQYVSVPILYDTFAGLCAEGWLSLWHPSALLAYFAGEKAATLEVVQVMELAKEADHQLLVRGRAGGNFYSALAHSWTADIGHYVILPAKFEQRRLELLSFLEEHNWLLSDSEAPTIVQDEESLF